MPRMTIFRSELSLVVLLASAAGTLPAAVAQAATAPTYKVKPGDTLWSIARVLLGDPFLWPQVYRLNTQVVEDPHWIYPGEVLSLVAQEGARAVPAQETPAPAVERAAAPLPAEAPAGSVVRQVEVDQQAPDTLFARRKGIDARTALRTYREQPYRPLRRGEFYSAGFLTEGEALPFGQLLGSVSPLQIRNITERANATLFATVAIKPPAGASYRPGDSLLLVQVFDGFRGHGDIVFPTGMARVTGQNDGQAVAEVIAVYGPIRNGQLALPAEKFVSGGTSRAQPVSNGVVGRVLGQREARELQHPQDFLFLDVGRKDGVAPGDIFEIRRDPHPRVGTSDTVDELMATVQVVHVRDKSATVKVLQVAAPDIPPGTRAKQVGKLPA